MVTRTWTAVVIASVNFRLKSPPIHSVIHDVNDCLQVTYSMLHDWD